MKRLTTILMLVMAAVLALGACGDDDEPVASGGGDRTTEPGDAPAPADEPPTITGPIATVTPGTVGSDCEAILDDPDGVVSSDDPPPKCSSKPTGNTGTVLIAAGTGEGDVDAASISVTADTELLVSDGGNGWEAGRFEDLAPGMTIRAWSTGGIAESYPVQFQAGVLTYELAGSGTSSSVPTTSSSVPTTSEPGGSGGSPTEAGPPASDPTTTGVVEGVFGIGCLSPTTAGTPCINDDGSIGSLSVAADAKGIDLVAKLTADTVVLRADGNGGWSQVTLDGANLSSDIKTGEHVRIWVVGNILTKSIPAQGVAETVVIGG